MHSSASGTVVGRVAGLWRYPVKSMCGEALAEAEVSWHGLAGDRRWAFVRPGAVESSFPWHTLRERGDLSHYRPSFVDPSRPEQSAIVVETPGGARLVVTDPALAAEIGPEGVWPMKQHRGVFDTFPLSLISTDTIARLGESVGRRLEVERFRPNLLVEAATAAPYPEDLWVGRVLRLGTLRLRVDKRDGRCLVITIDPATTQRDPQILRRVAADRQGCLGVYGSTVEPGQIAVGDPVVLES